MNCNICKSPWHPATGHFISDKMRWCGPCTTSWVKELAGMQRRRWGGVNFYDHAKPAPPVKNYIFDVFAKVPGKDHTYKSIEVNGFGKNLAEALENLRETYPDHNIAEHLKGLWREV